MRGLLIIMAFWGLGVIGNKWLHLPLPGNLLGMLLLTLALSMGWIKLNVVERASSFFLRNMLLFFIPILIGITTQLPLLKSNPWPIVLALLLGPALVMLCTGGIVQAFLGKAKAKAERSEEGRAFDA